MPETLILHVLDSRGRLRELLPAITTSVSQAWARVAILMPLHPVDVVVMAGTNVIPDLGHAGYCPDAGTIFLTFDPGNPACAHHLGPALCATVAHEAHHAMRWTGPGYGTTLGAALVTEGLAICFEHEAFPHKAMPWEVLPDEHRKAAMAQAAADWDNTAYDHEAWFFGGEGRLAWEELGYALGTAIVRDWLVAAPGRTAAAAWDVQHEEVRPDIS